MVGSFANKPKKKQIQAGTELNAQLRVRVSLKPQVLRFLCNCLSCSPTAMNVAVEDNLSPQNESQICKYKLNF